MSTNSTMKIDENPQMNQTSYASSLQKLTVENDRQVCLYFSVCFIFTSISMYTCLFWKNDTIDGNNEKPRNCHISLNMFNY